MQLNIGFMRMLVLPFYFPELLILHWPEGKGAPGARAFTSPAIVCLFCR